MDSLDPHSILGIAPEATPAEIRAAYAARLQEIREAIRNGSPPPAYGSFQLREACETLLRPHGESLHGDSPQALPVPGTAAPPPREETPAIAQPPLQPREFRFTFAGKGEEYFRIWIVNVFLSFVTLGIYSAWAKVRREKYFHNATLLDGSSFDYHGAPLAILKGRIVVFAIFMILSAAQNFDPGTYALLLLLLVPLAPWFAVRAFRFRAHNTSYRGIRFAFLGNYGEALKVIVGHGLLTLLTLGLLYPYWYARLRLFVVNNIAYGATRLTSMSNAGQIAKALLRPMMTASLAFLPLLVAFIFLIGFMVSHAREGGELEQTMSPGLALLAIFGPFLLILLMAVAVVYFKCLFTVRTGNLLFDGARLGDLRLSSRLELGPYIGIALTNWLLIMMSMGLYAPFARVRMAQYRVEALGLSAPDGLDAFVGDEQQRITALGDEASEMFDLDIAL